MPLDNLFSEIEDEIPLSDEDVELALTLAPILDTEEN